MNFHHIIMSENVGNNVGYIYTLIKVNKCQAVYTEHTFMDQLIAYVIYGAIALLSLYYCYLHYSSYFSKPKTDSLKPPPEAGGARFVTGHLHLMESRSSDKLRYKILGSVADKYGPIFTIRLGVKRVLIVSSSELTKELFTTNDLAIMTRPPFVADDYLSYNFASFGFAQYGPYWREMRKLVTTELLSARRIELQRSIRMSEMEQFSKELYSLWEKERDGSGKVLVNMKRWMGNLSLNLVTMTVVGKRFYGGDDSETTKIWRRVMREFFELVGQFVPGDAMPYLRWLDIGGFEKRMKYAAKELDKMIGGWLAELREKEYSGDDDKAQNFMEVMISHVQANQTLQAYYDVDTIIKATCSVLITAASDTTLVILIWAFSLLLNNRDVLKKAQEELDEHVGRERRVDESDLSKLAYLHAIVKETLRLYPPTPISPPRWFLEDCNIGGYHVKKGTFLLINLWKLHRDPQVWSDDVLEFKPERFLNRNVEVKGQDFELMPFGGGRRMCPGSNLGLRMVHFVLADMLHAFDLSTPSNERVDMTESIGLSNMKATPLEILLSPRLSPNLY